MPHYPEQRFISRLALIQRTVSLPENVVGVIDVAEDKRVDVRDVVARGVPPSSHVIVNAAEELGLRKPEQLEAHLLVEIDEIVEEISAIAARGRRRLYSPVHGRIAAVDRGRILIEEMPPTITVEAGLRGRVIQIEPGKGATIESLGAQIQGVWGNDRRGLAALRAEPDSGIDSAMQTGALDVRFMGAIVFTRRSLTADTLKNMEELGLAGIIAPSMDYALRPLAQQVNKPVIIIEQFGTASLSRAVFNILNEFEGQNVLVDAYLPRSWGARRPEVIINQQPAQGETPTRPNTMLTLRTGMTVRLTRDPYGGQTGQIAYLPKTPVLLDNGLRVPCARIDLIGGEQLYVPLENLEVIGK